MAKDVTEARVPIPIKVFSVSGSGRPNHYVLGSTQHYIGEVSGETITVPLINALDTLSNYSLRRLGINASEVRAEYAALMDKVEGLRKSSVSEDRDRAVKLQEEYRAKRAIRINTGFEEALCVMEYLARGIKQRESITPFTGGTRDRIDGYKLE